MSRKGYISVRVDDDIDKWVSNFKKEQNISKSDVIRSVLKSHIYGTNHITIKKEKIVDYEKELEGRFKMSAIIKKFGNYAMNIIVRKEEYNLQDSVIDKDITVMIKAINNKIDSVEEIDNDYKYLLNLKELFNNKDFDKIKTVINYKQKRWKWILSGRVVANKLETVILENRLQELKTKEQIASDRTKS